MPEWSLKTNGASNQKGARTGFILKYLEGIVHEKAIHLGFPTSNNEAEYGALIGRMLAIEELGIWDLKLFHDSQLIMKQVSGVC